MSKRHIKTKEGYGVLLRLVYDREWEEYQIIYHRAATPEDVMVFGRSKWLVEKAKEYNTDDKDDALSTLDAMFDEAKRAALSTLNVYNEKALQSVIAHNNDRYGEGSWCFIPTVQTDSPDLCGLGVCVGGVQGFYPVSTIVIGARDYNALANFADYLNADLGMNVEQAGRMATSSMKPLSEEV